MIDFTKITLNSAKLNILSDRGILQAIDDGRISIGSYTPDQIQPGSVDLRIGDVRIYDHEIMARTMSEFSARPPFKDEDSSTDFARVIEGVKDTPIVIPSGAFAEIFIHDDIRFSPDDYIVNVDLRSSRGRLGLSLSENNLKEEDGRYYVSLWNRNPNPIVLYGQSKFAQLFFYPDSPPADGYIVTDFDEAEDIAHKIVCDEMPELFGPYMVFYLGDHILKFREGFGPIDTKVDYSEDELYHVHDTSEPFILKPEDCIITQLHPKLRLPPDIGVQLFNYIPYAWRTGGFGPDLSHYGLEAHSANATWVDPGYDGNITGHPVMRNHKVKLNKGDPIALARIYRYDQPVLRPYGSDKKLGNHYQGSHGVGHRS